MNIQEDIKMIKKNLNRQFLNDEIFYSPTYKYSNECITYYQDLFDVNNKSVLTVCGSGDQCLSALYSKASKVDVFDINKLTYYMTLLKIYMIKYYSYFEFCDFYNNIGNRVYYIERLLHKNVTQDFITFWQIFKNNVGDFLLDKYTNVINVAANIPYLNIENFTMLKTRLKNFTLNFEHVDIIQKPEIYTKKYDFINLSNIFDYSKKELFVKSINKIVQNNLTDNGNILLTYEWYCDNQNKASEYLKNELSAQQIDFKDSNGKSNRILIVTKNNY